jgi:F0F1-type ATP synthase membrane subunit b/b'
MLAALEAKLKAFWHDLTGEARAELEKALADARAAEAQLEPLLAAFRADLEKAVAGAEPGLKAAVEDLAAKLAADVAAILE